MAERKKFIDVEIPILGKTIQVLGTPKDVVNKNIKLDLSRKLRGKGVIITLRVFNQDDKLVAIPKRMELMMSYLRRIIRKRTDNVEDSFLVHTSDIRATIKPFLITRKKVSRAVRKNLRNTAREFLINHLKEKSYYEISNEILNGTLQKDLLPKLKKVYPLAFCDFRVFETKDLEKLDISKILTDVQVSQDNEEDTEVQIEDEHQEGGEETDSKDKESQEEELVEEEKDAVKK